MRISDVKISVIIGIIRVAYYESEVIHGRSSVVEIVFTGYIYDLGKKYNYEASTHDFLRNLVHLAENTRKFRQN